MIQVFAFYLFAVLTIASGALTILSRNPVHSVLWLILSFFNAAGLMVLAGAEFIAMLLVIVYVGAVAVLFLFVVMMLDIDFAALRAGFVRNFPLGVAVAVVLLAEIVLGVGRLPYRRAAAWNQRGQRQTDGLHQQHRRDRRPTLRALLVPVRSGGVDPVGGDDRRDRADTPPADRLQASEDQPPERAAAAGRDGQHAARDRRGSDAVIGIEHYIVVSSILFVLGVLGIFLNRKNVIVILMAIELILLAVSLNLVAFSAFLHDLTGQIFAMFVLTVAAGEAAIGLAILVIYFRDRGTIAVDDVNRMKG